MSTVRSFQNFVIANVRASEEVKSTLNDFLTALDTDLETVGYVSSSDVEEAEEAFNKSLVYENSIEQELEMAAEAETNDPIDDSVDPAIEDVEDVDYGDDDDTQDSPELDDMPAVEEVESTEEDEETEDANENIDCEEDDDELTT